MWLSTGKSASPAGSQEFTESDWVTPIAVQGSPGDQQYEISEVITFELWILLTHDDMTRILAGIVGAVEDRVVEQLVW
jgi:hypothetical protein